ncbi:MAG: adenylate/guanylate cyclase domain-containing protein [Saprospiraceae bacterium]
MKARKGREKDGFEMRIGIHTGPVVAGIVGSRKFDAIYGEITKSGCPDGAKQ